MDGVNSLLLFNSKVITVNRKKLEAKVKNHDLADAYTGIIKLGKQVKAGKIDMEKATDSIIELGRSLKKR